MFSNDNDKERENIKRKRTGEREVPPSNKPADYDKQLGLFGVDKLSKQMDKDTKSMEKSNKELRSGLFSFGQLKDVNVTSIDGEAADEIANSMSNVVLKVRVVSALKDLIYPLFDRYAIAQTEHENFLAKHFNTTNNLLNALNNSSAKKLPEVIDAVNKQRLSFRDIFLSPMNGSYFKSMSSALGSAVLAGIKMLPTAAVFGFRFLFGRKQKELSELEKIRKNSDQSLAFQKTGQFKQTEGFFTGILNRGLIGSLARGAALATARVAGAGKSRAQEIEDRESRGEGGAKGLRDQIAKFLSGNRTILKELGVDKRKSSTVTDEFNKTEVIKLPYEYMSLMQSMVCGSDGCARMTKMGEDITDLVEVTYNSHKVEKKMLREMVKARRQAFFSSILSFAGSTVGRLLSVIAGLGLVGGAIALVKRAVFGLGTRIMGGLRSLGSTISSKFTSMMDNLRGRFDSLRQSVTDRARSGWQSARERAARVTSRALDYGRTAMRYGAQAPRLLRGATIGGAAGIGLDYAADYLGRDNRMGAITDTISTSMMYAGLGGAGGAVVGGGIGSVPAAAVGATGGMLYGMGVGMYQNRNALFGIDDTPRITPSLDEQMSGFGDFGSSDRIAEEIARVTMEQTDRANEELENTRQMVQLLKDIKSSGMINTDQQIPSPFAGDNVDPLIFPMR